MKPDETVSAQSVPVAEPETQVKPEPSVKPAVSDGAGIEEKLPNFVPRALSTYLSRRISRVHILWIRQRPMPLFLLK